MTPTPARPTSPLSPAAESRPGLLRALGPGMALAMVVGNVIGSGIFLKPGGIAADAGKFPMILSAWVLGGVVCLLGALCLAELAVMLPRAGGLYVYLREAYGRPVAFLFGWCEFLFSRPASIGALSVAFVGAMGEATQRKFDSIESVAMALTLIALMAWANIIGVIWGGRLQALTTLIKAGFLAVVALLPFVVSQGTSSGLDWNNFSTTIAEPRQATFTAQFAAAMLAVMWAYNGWHGVTPVAEEVRDPRRNIPLALFGGIGILVLLYVGANVAYHGVLSMSEMASANTDAAQTMVRKLLTPFGASAAQAGVAVMSAVIMCSVLGAINSNMLNGPRVSFAMGRDDVFVRQLGRVHVNYRTPAVAIVVQAFMAAALVVSVAVLVEIVPQLKDKDRSVFDVLTDYVVFSASVFFMLSVMALFVLRRRQPNWDRPYRTFGYPVVPVLYLAFYLWFVIQIVVKQQAEVLVGVGLILAGLPFYFAWRAYAHRHPEVLHDGE